MGCLDLCIENGKTMIWQGKVKAYCSFIFFTDNLFSLSGCSWMISLLSLRASFTQKVRVCASTTMSVLGSILKPHHNLPMYLIQANSDNHGIPTLTGSGVLGQFSIPFRPLLRVAAAPAPTVAASQADTRLSHQHSPIQGCNSADG